MSILCLRHECCLVIPAAVPEPGFEDFMSLAQQQLHDRRVVEDQRREVR